MQTLSTVIASHFIFPFASPINSSSSSQINRKLPSFMLLRDGCYVTHLWCLSILHHCDRRNKINFVIGVFYSLLNFQCSIWAIKSVYKKSISKIALLHSFTTYINYGLKLTNHKTHFKKFMMRNSNGVKERKIHQ